MPRSGELVMAGVRVEPGPCVPVVPWSGVLIIAGRRAAELLRPGTVMETRLLTGRRAAELLRPGTVMETRLLTGRRAAELPRPGTVMETRLLTGRPAGAHAPSGVDVLEQLPGAVDGLGQARVEIFCPIPETLHGASTVAFEIRSRYICNVRQPSLLDKI